MPKTLILIPSRMAATRLPGKPLLKIGGITMISRVYKKAKETKIGDVFVATEDQEIFDEIVKSGGKSIITSKEHKTGTDRIFEAYEKLNLKNIDYVLLIQGDEPMIDVEDIINLNNVIIKNKSKIGTLACKIEKKSYLNNENIVKVETEEKLDNKKISKAKDFFRKFMDSKKQNIYHHIGVYQYNVSILKKIVSMNQSINEIKNRLEQFRAIDNNIDIDVVLAKTSSIGVDTNEDYLEIKKLLEYKE